MPTLHTYDVASRPPELTCLLSDGDVDECMEYVACNRNGQAAADLFAAASSLPGDEQIAGLLTRGTLAAAAISRAGAGPAVLGTLGLHLPHASSRARPIRVLLLGASAMTEEIAAHLLDVGITSRQAAIIGLCARDKQKALRVAARFGLPCLSAQEAAKSLLDVDAVVATGRGPAALLSEPVLAPVLNARPNPLLVIDLGIPRNLEPCLAQRDGLNAIFRDQLGASHARNGFWLGQSINQSDPLGCGR